jgi:hypothetical protein
MRQFDYINTNIIKNYVFLINFIILVPHLAQVPLQHALPLDVVPFLGSFIACFDLHFTQKQFSPILYIP